jgi:hypothetical protein
MISLTEKKKKKIKQKKLKYGNVQHAFNIIGSLPEVLSTIVNEMKLDNNEIARKWNMSWQQAKSCNISFSGDEVILKVEQRKGGFRISGEDPRNLLGELNEVRKVLSKFEDAIRKEFKKRTGKTLRLKERKIVSNFEPVAYNGLYRFFAVKIATASAALDGQQWQDG